MTTHRKAAVGPCAAALSAALFLPAAAEHPRAQPTSLGPLAGQSGEEIYRGVCQGCHMPDAKGAVGAGAYPALSGNPRMRSATYAAMVIVRGQRGMPPFGDYLSDAQIADLVNYLRTNFGNHYTDRIAADDVKQLRFALPR